MSTNYYVTRVRDSSVHTAESNKRKGKGVYIPQYTEYFRPGAKFKEGPWNEIYWCYSNLQGTGAHKHEFSDNFDCGAVPYLLKMTSFSFSNDVFIDKTSPTINGNTTNARKEIQPLQEDFPTPTIKITNQKSSLVRIILSRDVHFTFFWPKRSLTSKWQD